MNDVVILQQELQRLERLICEQQKRIEKLESQTPAGIAGNFWAAWQREAEGRKKEK